MGKKSLLEASTNYDTPRMVSENEIQWETQAISEEDNEENYHYLPKERNRIETHQRRNLSK